MPYIHELPGWPGFSWESESLAATLAEVRRAQGRLRGRMEALGFGLRSEASLTVLTADVVKSSAIEGEALDPEEGRSSIARRLGLEAGGLPTPRRVLSDIKTIKAVAREGGRIATYRVACKLRDSGMSEAEALEVQCRWNQTIASPRWSDEKLQHKTASAYAG